MKGRVLNSVTADKKNIVEDLFLVNAKELVENLEKSLKEGIVKFEYLKVSDNSVRQAFGTLKGELIPNKADKVRSDAYVKVSEIALAGSGDLNEMLTIMTETDNWFQKEGTKAAKPKAPDTIVYYDLEAQAFRSFKKENLISVYA